MRRIWIWGLGLAVACGGKQASDSGTSGNGGTSAKPGGAIAGVGAAPERASLDEWRAPDQTETPPIPPFPDLCSRYDIVRSAGAPGETQPTLTCPCGGGIYSWCDASGCVTSFSCDALCATPDQRAPSLFDCLGTCELGHDYGGGIECVQLPGAAGGTFRIGPWCLADDHCGAEAHCVAVTEEGLRVCSHYAECNTQSDCRSDQRCARPDDSFLGFCGDGRDGSLCFTDDDCRANARCVLGASSPSRPELGLCSSGERAAPCVADDDCAEARCRSSKCSSGELHDGCLTSSDCKAGLHCQNWGITYDPEFALCSDGSVSSTCQTDADCAEGLYCAQGMCQDGSDESYCRDDAQCRSSRCQLAADGPTCTTGKTEARCNDGDDCVSGNCVRSPGTLAWQSGRCD